MRYLAPILAACTTVATAALVFACVVRAFVPVQPVQAATVAYVPHNAQEQWAIDLSARLGNMAPTAEMVAFLVAWQRAEGGMYGVSDFNPLNTTQDMEGATIFNSHGVKNYVSYEQGLEATAITLGYSFEGYADIRQGIITNDVAQALRGLYASPWGTSAGLVEQIYHEIIRQITVQPVSTKCLPTDSGVVSANYYSTGSSYWSGQAGGMHLGTDYTAAQSEAVYAPFDFTVEMIGFYGDAGRYGDYIQGWLDDGTLIYLGHLQNVNVSAGQRVAACQQIGEIGPLAHTHIKLAPADAPIPCEGSGACIDFEQFYKEY